MRYSVILLAALAVMAATPVAWAGAPRSVSGTWKVKSLKVGGTPTKTFGELADGAVWKLKAGGKATIAGADDWRWTYSPSKGELVIERPALFGLATERMTFSVTEKGRDLTLRYTFLWVAGELVLTRD